MTSQHSPTLASTGRPGTACRVRTASLAAWLGCAAACVETGGGTPKVGPDVPGAALCEATVPPPYGGVAPIPSVDTAPAGPYLWKNVVIKGGGFVSGLVSSPTLPGLLFARTDVGGAYRFSPATGRWLPLTDWVGRDSSNLMGIESIAADPVDPNRVYLAAGTYLTAGNGSILSSSDMGQTWTRNPIAAPMGGNADGRSMGERLAIDPNLPSLLFFGSRNAGLWQSSDAATTWAQVAFPDSGASGAGLAFLAFDAKSGVPGLPTPALYVGVGITTAAALYRSLDAGATWEAVAGQPVGMMPHHGVFDGCGNLYLAYNDGPGPSNVTRGAIWRFATATGTFTDVSPPRGQGGFGGISADARRPGTLLVTTLDRWVQGDIYRTTDGGASWVNLAARFERDVNGAPWLWWHANPPALPLLGWMGDVEIDPFDSGRALFITGQGIWSTADLTAADTGAATHWKFDNDGLEETVPLDLASPPAGAPLLSGLGDIGGFRHDDLDVSPPAGMFGPPIFGNTTSLDFAEAVPAIVARVGTASGSAKGAYSTDGGATWTGFAGAPTGSTGQGSIAVSADGTRFLWSPRGATPSYSINQGATWTTCTGLSGSLQVAADRVDPALFYASSRNGTYVSSDGGTTFLRTVSLSGRPRPVPGLAGHVFIANNTGLYRSQDAAATFTQVMQVGGATGVGFGIAAPGELHPAVYLAGTVAAVGGIFRSDDAGATWQRIDDPQHQFGYINCLTGDPRRFGRVYLGTSGRGILYGDLR